MGHEIIIKYYAMTPYDNKKQKCWQNSNHSEERMVLLVYHEDITRAPPRKTTPLATNQARTKSIDLGNQPDFVVAQPNVAWYILKPSDRPTVGGLAASPQIDRGASTAIDNL